MPSDDDLRSGESRAVLGTWTFAGDRIWGSSDEREAIRVVHAALDLGITLFDSAPNYGDGRSEELLGKALRGRSEARVATKIKIAGVTAEDIESSVQLSLKRLNRDQIDLMQIHWPAPSTDETSRALDIFEELQSRGLIKEIGVCNFGTFDLEEQKHRTLASNQLPYSLLWRVIESDIGPASESFDVPVIAYTALQQGLLSGRYRGLDAFPEGRRRTRLFSSLNSAAGHGEPGHEDLVEKALTRLFAIARESDCTMPELALGFAAAQPWIDRVLVGARTVDQIYGSVRALDQRLSDGVIAEIDQATLELKRALGANPDMYQAQSRVRHRE